MLLNRSYRAVGIIDLEGNLGPAATPSAIGEGNSEPAIIHGDNLNVAQWSAPNRRQ